jgi:hypothetical protein
MQMSSQKGGKKEGTQLWGLGFDSKSLLFSLSPLFFFFYFFFQPPFKQGTRNSGRRTAILPVCVYLCGIDLTSKPPREEKRFVSFYRRRNTQREKEKERKKRVEMVESVTRANRITLYFPPDEGWWLWYGGEDLRRRWGG